MTTPQTVRSTLTPKTLVTAWRSLHTFRGLRDAETRIRRHVDAARRDRTIEDLVEAWAEVQTESLMRQILATPMSWAGFRTPDLDAYADDVCPRGCGMLHLGRCPE